MSYYYLVASLPSLTLGEPPTLTAERFQFNCTGVLSDEDMHELGRVLEGRGDEGRTVFSRSWHSMDTQLRNAIAAQRASATGRDASSFQKGHAEYTTQIDRALAEAFAKQNPLERELAVDHCRWQLLDQLGDAEPFGLAVVLAYALKLQLAERWAGLSEEIGNAKLNEIIEANSHANYSA